MQKAPLLIVGGGRVRVVLHGGLGKLLIQKYNFTGEQVTEVWNLSDGCGGAGDHATH